MCRILLLHNPDGLKPDEYLEAFSQICKNSREYQGHGWGCAWLDGDNAWQMYHDISPVWLDTNRDFPETSLFLAHARSAFRDEGIQVENNMPFQVADRVFLFNGELHGVRVKAEGRIGAEKIFNYLLRFDKGDLNEAVRRGTEIIEKRTRYVRAMNFFLATRDAVQVFSLYNEDADYFQMHQAHHDETHVVCSGPLPIAGCTDWSVIPNRSLINLNLS